MPLQITVLSVNNITARSHATWAPIKSIFPQASSKKRKYANTKFSSTRGLFKILYKEATSGVYLSYISLNISENLSVPYALVLTCNFLILSYFANIQWTHKYE